MTRQKKKNLSLRMRAYRTVRKVLLIFVVVSIANVVFSSVFYTPKMYRIMRANEQMRLKYYLLQDRIRTDQQRLDEIRHRDNFVYRGLFSADTISLAGVYTPYDNAKYARLADDDYTPLMTSTWKQLDRFGREIYRSSVSLDELQRLAQNKDHMSAAIPAIWPIDREDLRNGIGPYGMRIHPKFGGLRMHTGVDLAASTGDPVYATGDAIVKESDPYERMRGYGKLILLDHQFGYQTRYAHLNNIYVKEGERVARGQLIGRVGNTGVSTGPHLHYEVIHNGAHVNPINYFDRNMTNEEYERLMEQMRELNFSIMD